MKMLLTVIKRSNSDNLYDHLPIFVVPKGSLKLWFEWVAKEVVVVALAAKEFAPPLIQLFTADVVVACTPAECITVPLATSCSPL